MLNTLDFNKIDSLSNEITFAKIESKIILIKNVPEELSDNLLKQIASMLGQAATYTNSIYGKEEIHTLNANAPPLIPDGIDWHTEDSYRDPPPRFVALYCETGSTTVNTLFCLIEPKYRSLGNKTEVKPDPYLYCCKKTLSMPINFKNKNQNGGFRYDEALIPDSKKFLSLKSKLSLNLNKGDLIIFDNHQIAHAKYGKDLSKVRKLKRVIIL